MFVNRRPVENRGINFALLEGYHTALMKGRYPVCCLFLEINPAAVDVNIHPAKREVKFHQEGPVRRLMAQAVRETLLNFHAGTQGKESVPAAESPRTSPTAPTQPTLSLPSLPAARPQELPPSVADIPAQRVVPASKETPVWPARVTTELEPAVAKTASGYPRPNPEPFAPATPVPLLKVPLRLVGVIGRLYVVLESDRGLVLLDQHAAHERILFEQMLNRLEQQGNAASQKLLLPETVELSVRDAHFLREQLAALTRMGVGLSEFGERTFLLDALPPFVKAPDARRFVLELVDELKSAGPGSEQPAAGRTYNCQDCLPACGQGQ